MFLKLKRDVDINGRVDDGGNKQNGFISKEEASSPTVLTDTVLLSYIIDAQEHRDVATIDITNAFIQTCIKNIEDTENIIVRGALVDALVEIAPDIYGPYVRTDKKGVKTLILRCHNTIYGTMVTSILHYKTFSRMIKHLGFKINPYDPCVANRMIDDNHHKICWHVDECKISHVDRKVNGN